MRRTKRDWRQDYRSKLVSAEEAAKVIQSDDSVYMATNGEPPLLCRTLLARVGELKNVKVMSGGVVTNFGWPEELFRQSFRYGVESAYAGDWIHSALSRNECDFFPNLYSARGNVLDRGQLPVDVVMLSVSAPDGKGFCSFGTSVWNKPTYCARAKKILVEVNANLIRTFGTNSIHVSDVDYIVENTVPITVVSRPKPDKALEQVARNVSSLIKDGDTIEMGFSSATYAFTSLGIFREKNDLGWHSEVTPPGVPTLVRDGVINGKYKQIKPGIAVATQTSPDPEERKIVNENPLFELHDVAYTNDVRIIAAHDNFVAINGAVSVDLTGQVNCEVLPGNYPQNGAGGQVEFALGALLSKGGRSIHAFRSSDKAGKHSRIVPLFTDEPVGVPRTLSDYIVTEYGVACMQGKCLRERAEALINIAHPDFRPELKKFLLNRSISTPG